MCISGSLRSPRARSRAGQVEMTVPGRLLYLLIISKEGMKKNEWMGEWKEGEQGRRQMMDRGADEGWMRRWMEGRKDR